MSARPRPVAILPDSPFFSDCLWSQSSLPPVQTTALCALEKAWPLICQPSAICPHDLSNLQIGLLLSLEFRLCLQDQVQSPYPASMSPISSL